MKAKTSRITLSTAVPVELKERVQHIAEVRNWTISQTMVLFLEGYLELWEKELGIERNTHKTKKSKT